MQASSAPPSSLRTALRPGAEQTHKQAWVDWLFSRVAARYDLGNDLMSLGWHKRWKRRLVEMAFREVPPGARVLDLASGTGDVALMVAAADPAAEVVGTDINPDMLALAEAKQPPGLRNVRWQQADATALPFADGSFDVVLCAYAGRGFPDWEAVLREVHRVLVPGGRFANLDFARPPVRWWDAVYRGWMVVSGAILGAVLHGDPVTYVYIPMSMGRYRGQRWLDERMQATGFDTRLIETRACLMAFNVGTRRAERDGGAPDCAASGDARIDRALAGNHGSSPHMPGIATVGRAPRRRHGDGK
jgi:ubiquinone/menaquinone biosynthesis methyltransferase